MTRFPRPVVVASNCLDLAGCRYNGQTIRAPFVRRLEPFVDLRPICPEVEIGLGVPRDPIRLLIGVGAGAVELVQPATGRDVTVAMREFSARFLDALAEVDGFILKSRSPSCGIRDTKIYRDRDARGAVGRGAGLFGHAVLERFPHAAVEDELRLADARLRHHFLVKVFARAAFRAARSAGHVAELRDFHDRHTLQLEVCNRAALRAGGRVLADADRHPAPEVAARYEAQLTRALASPARTGPAIGVLLHALGRCSARVAMGERRRFRSIVGRYRAGRTPLTVPLALVASWIERFGDPTLARQTFLRSYPRALFDAREAIRA